MRGDEVRSYLIDKIEGSASWRFQKAEQHPDDPRNERSAEALTQLHQSLLQIPATDSLFAAYWAACYWPAATEENVDNRNEEQSLIEDNLIRRYGFDRQESGDAREFLTRLNGLLRDAKSHTG